MTSWLRVTREHRCPICGKDSWCMYNEQVVLCMRIAGGREHTLRDGSIGWIHPLPDGPLPLPDEPEREPEVVINVAAILNDWKRNPANHQLDRFARYLGVHQASLTQLGCVHAPNYSTWAFPMRDGFGNYTGIRLRNERGEKWAVKGSHQGIFLPDATVQATAMLCEGPTDTAAALSIGFYAVGRPSCSGGMRDVRVAFQRLGVRRAVIVADNDDPGLRGADMLARQLPIPTCVLVLPCKDVRQFVNDGATKEVVDSMINGLLWKQPEYEKAET